jgi:hypothetical protein
MDRAELEALIGTVETWAQIFGVTVAIGIVGEVGFGIKLWMLNRRHAEILHSEDLNRQGKMAALNSEAGLARKDAAAAIERASRAEENLAGANERSAQANERAANAEREAARLGAVAEEERLARLKIEERIRPRRLSPRQRESIRAALSAYNGAIVRISTVADDAESFNLGADIKDAVSSAGWQVAFFGPVAYLGPSASQLPSGVEIRVGGMLNAPAVALLRALRDQGIDVAIRLEEAEKSGDVIVVVGAKP